MISAGEMTCSRITRSNSGRPNPPSPSHSFPLSVILRKSASVMCSLGWNGCGIRFKLQQMTQMRMKASNVMRSNNRLEVKEISRLCPKQAFLNIQPGQRLGRLMEMMVHSTAQLTCARGSFQREGVRMIKKRYKRYSSHSPSLSNMRKSLPASSWRRRTPGLSDRPIRCCPETAGPTAALLRQQLMLDWVPVNLHQHVLTLRPRVTS